MVRFILVLLACIGIGALLAVADLGYSSFKYEMQLKAAESKCIAKFIKYEVERKDIITKEGKCYVSYMSK